MDQGKDEHLGFPELIEKAVVPDEQLSDRGIRELGHYTSAPGDLT
jgi:hypothetical protein